MRLRAQFGGPCKLHLARCPSLIAPPGSLVDVIWERNLAFGRKGVGGAMSKPPKKGSMPALGGRVQNKETPAQEGIDKFVESLQVTVSETSDYVSGFALGALGQLVMPFVTEPVPYIPAEGVKNDKGKVASLPRLLRLLPRPRDLLLCIRLFSVVRSRWLSVVSMARDCFASLSPFSQWTPGRKSQL